MAHGIRTLFVSLLIVLPALGQGYEILNPTKDATIYDAGSPVANGAGALVVGRTGSCLERRILVQFDLSGVPAGANIQDVNLSFSVSGGNAANPQPLEVSVAPVLQAWSEGTSVPANLGQGAPAQPGDVTWTHADFPSTPWITNGGDFGSEVARVGLSTGGYGAASSFVFPGLKTQVEDWINDPSTNHGLLVRIVPTVSTCQFTRVLDSREEPSPPVLTVFYDQGGDPQAAILGDGFLFPDTNPDRLLVANGLPIPGTIGFRLQHDVPVVGTSVLYVSFPGVTNFIPALGTYSFLDLGTLGFNLLNGVGPFPATLDPFTNQPRWYFDIPNQYALVGSVVTFQCFEFAPNGVFGTNAITFRVGT